MTMLISKFNRLISSRLLWGAILVLIIFAFVVWGMQWPSDIAAFEAQNTAGELDGEKISSAQYQAAYASTYLAYLLQHGRATLGTPETEAQLRRDTWTRIASLRQAQKFGLSVPQNELLTSIRSSFSDQNGAFQSEQYQDFVHRQLPDLGFSEAQFERFFRQEILIHKLRLLIGRQALIPPLESQRIYAIFFDTYHLEYALISTNNLPQLSPPSQEDALALYHASPAAFELPETREIACVAFPYADYTSTNPIPDSEIHDYYDAHIQQYLSTTTNKNGETSTTIADLADVKDAISSLLAQSRDRDAATNAATTFAYSTIPGHDGTIPDFYQTASNAGFTVTSLDPFPKNANPLPDVGPEAPLTAFDLALNPYDRVSSPIPGQTALYVLYLRTIHPPRIPPFQECKDQVLAAASKKAVDDALSTLASTARSAAQTGLAKGLSFAQTLAPLGLQVQQADPFTSFSAANSQDPILHTLVQAALTANPGEITAPAPAPNGLLLAHVQSVTPAPRPDYEAYRPKINREIHGVRALSLFHSWQHSLLTPTRFTDYRASPPNMPPTESLDESPNESPTESPTESPDAAPEPAPDATPAI